MKNSSSKKNVKNARTSIINGVRKLLIGPLSESEILRNVPTQSGPTDFYLTGILWPKNTVIPPEEDERIESSESDDDLDTPEDSGTPLYSVFRPSSIGITCTIEGDQTPFKVVINGAKYKPVKSNHSEQQESNEIEKITNGSDNSIDGDIDTSTESKNENELNQDNNIVYNWIREPFEYFVNVNGKEKKTAWYNSIFQTKSGEKVEDSQVLVHIKRRVKNHSLIATVTLINNAEPSDNWDSDCLFQTQISIKTSQENDKRIISRPAYGAPKDEDDKVNELLYRNSLEYAVGHGISCDWELSHSEKVSWVRTEWLPQQIVSSVSPDGHKELNELRGSPKSPFSAEFLSNINNKTQIIESLSSFCKVYKSWIKKQKLKIKAIPSDFMKTANFNLENCETAHSRMLEGITILSESSHAFEAFAVANEVMDSQSRSLKKKLKNKDRFLIWRPFQLAFILLSLPSIVNKSLTSRNIMDLLWFPTGGGKTEAYLGLIAFTIFFRRLTERNDNEATHVDVIMRYTLRLLTVQQFQRAAEMICTADIIRKKDINRYGKTPISIGLFVGQAATPNKLCSENVNVKLTAANSIQEERDNGNPTSTPRLILDCPLCGTELTPFDYQVNCVERSMTVKCPNHHYCPSKNASLPIYTVDEEIYLKRPSLVIGTVDKFAQLPRNENTGILFGKPEGLPPDLIIQDELHLISGPLGTMTGLYETCIDGLSTRDGIRPKIVGSTATIGRASNQVRALFDRSVFQFPPPAIDADQSFFAVKDEDAPDRIYMGLSSAGRSPKFSLQASLASFFVMTKYLEDIESYPDDSIDPYWTTLIYFNSLRELGGAQVLMQDDVPRSIGFYSNRFKCEIRELEQEPVELTSRIPSTNIPEILKQLEFTLGDDPLKGEPIDSVLASNMISVGVDIPRLGLMVVNGQPKATSEFIQATSRVGRTQPGIILTIYNASRPRDLSHFEHFKNYHQALYRRVEATSVTPWSSRARDKALHAVFSASVRYLVPGMLERLSALNFDPAHPQVKNIVKDILKRVDNADQVFADSAETEQDLKYIIERWQLRAEKHRNLGNQLEYWAHLRPFNNKPVYPHLMRGAEDNFDDPEVWPTPNSMREVEPSSFYTEWRSYKKIRNKNGKT